VALITQVGRVSMQQVATDAFGNALGWSVASASTGTELHGQANNRLYSLGGSGDDGTGLRLGSGEGLRYGNVRASDVQDTAGDFDVSSIEGLRGTLPISEESWVLASGPQSTASDAGNGYGPGVRDALPSARAVAGVGASFGKMAYGTVRTLSDTFNQALDVVTGGAFHNTPLMQRSWENNSALGKGIINLAGSPVETATNLIEDVANRYSLASSITSDDFQRSYELGSLFNDVGQAALGLGAGVRSLSTELAKYGNYRLGNVGSATLAETGAVERLLYGARVGEGLPGISGVAVPGRPTPVQLEALTVKHDVEFAVTYKLGPGQNGRGGQYFLYSGEKGAVDVPLQSDMMLIYRTLVELHGQVHRT